MADSTTASTISTGFVRAFSLVGAVMLVAGSMARTLSSPLPGALAYGGPAHPAWPRARSSAAAMGSDFSAALLLSILTTIGLFLLRARRPDLPRPYRAIGYPALRAPFVALTLSVATILLIAEKTHAQTVSGLVLVLLGIPVYLLWRRLPVRPTPA